MIKMWFFNTGYCTVSEHHIFHDAPRRLTRAYALAVLLEHPSEGLMLFDTGYSPRILEAFKKFPYSIYGRLTPTMVQPEWMVAAQLKTLGLSPEDIRYVIVSHLHADHLAGLHDFKDATFFLSHQASSLLPLTGMRALKHGFLPMLWPQESKTSVIKAFLHEPMRHLGFTHDLFADGLLRLVKLPGHARGQMGVLVQATQGSVLLAADGAWTSRSYRENLKPNNLTMRMAFDDPAESLKTLNNLHLFHKQTPDLKIIPAHCPEIAQKVSLGIPTPLEALL
jgi:glyoxylase-like metal-dependent hydrolase (beta-lactamase superfamily II)